MVHKLGVDIGKSSFKFYWDGGQGSIPSWKAIGTSQQLLTGPGSNGNLQVNYEGTNYLLDSSALLGNLSWPTDDNKATLHNLVLMLGVLGKIGIYNADIIIGLPVAQVSNKKAVNDVKQLFNGVKHASINGTEYTFNINVSVVPEPLGTYYSLVLFKDQETGTIRLKQNSPFAKDLIALADIGYRTTDIVTTMGNNLGSIKDSTLSGTVMILDKAIHYLSTKHGMIKGNERAKVYNAITDKFGDTSLRINGIEVDATFWNEVTQLKKQLAQAIYDDTRSIISNIQPDRIIMTGGGALLLKEELSAIDKRLTFAENPRFANATGFYLLAKTRPSASS